MHEKGNHLTRILGKHAFLCSSFLYLAWGLCWYSDTLRLRSVPCPWVSDISFAGVQSIAAVSSLMSQGITHTERRTNMPLLRLHSKSLSLLLRLALWLILSHIRLNFHTDILNLQHFISSRHPHFQVSLGEQNPFLQGIDDNIEHLCRTRWFLYRHTSGICFMPLGVQ